MKIENNSAVPVVERQSTVKYLVFQPTVSSAAKTSCVQSNDPLTVWKNAQRGIIVKKIVP